MNGREQIRISKFLSLVLRHQPDAAGIHLDSAGWVDVDALLAGCAKVGRRLRSEDLERVVAENPKKRFEFSPDGQRIRASQGHSVGVDLQYRPQVPPDILYHGTATRFVDSIRRTGLTKMRRHHVHLSAETEMTMAVGARHGKAVLLTILAGEMHRRGFEFFISTNGVWLADHVPPEFIAICMDGMEDASPGLDAPGLDQALKSGSGHASAVGRLVRLDRDDEGLADGNTESDLYE